MNGNVQILNPAAAGNAAPHGRPRNRGPWPGVRRSAALLLSTGLLAAGCGRNETSRTDTSDTEPPNSTMQQVVDGVTGRSAVRAGRQAEEQIREVSEERNRQLDEILGE